MNKNGEQRTNVLRSIGKNAMLLTLLGGGGKLLAHVIINSASGAFTGHIDAGCAVDVNCTNMVLETVRNLPYIIPGLFQLGKGVKFVVNSCSVHPDGGTNQSISGKVE